MIPANFSVFFILFLSVENHPLTEREPVARLLTLLRKAHPP